MQWYLSTKNITTSVSPQPDVCSTNCSDDTVILSNVLTYTGNIHDDGNTLCCTAVNIEVQELVRSSGRTIAIWCKHCCTIKVWFPFCWNELYFILHTISSSRRKMKYIWVHRNMSDVDNTTDLILLMWPEKQIKCFHLLVGSLPRQVAYVKYS